MTLTPFQRYKARWDHCRRCPLHKSRKRVVLVRGSLPSEILFVGEAPGINEDVLGKPFIGPAGKLLDRMIEDAGLSECRLAFTNLIACIPWDEDNGRKVQEPPKEAIEACAPRLVELVALARPKVIVFVGKLAAKYGFPGYEEYPHTVEIIHPAAILRADISQKGLAIQRTIVTLEETLEYL